MPSDPSSPATAPADDNAEQCGLTNVRKRVGQPALLRDGPMKSPASRFLSMEA